MRNSMRKCLAYCSLLLLSATFLGAALIQPTVARWTDQELTSTSLSALSLGPVLNPQCTDRDTLANLLNNQVLLTWQRPTEVPDDVELEYVITWDVLGSLVGDGSTVTTELSHTYQTGLALLNLRVAFTVVPRIVDVAWVGDPVEMEAAAIALIIIPVYLACSE